jgi:NAD(P)H-hydrate repair Nnr-like enzyme with NAD(P)H-hydrate epimerase domain
MALLELLTPSEMAEADRLAVREGVASFDLMMSAGRAVADAAQEMAKDGEILVLVGPGNNGGDGLVAAQLLSAAGRRARVALLGARGALKGDAAKAASLYKSAVEPAGPN